MKKYLATPQPLVCLPPIRPCSLAPTSRYPTLLFPVKDSMLYTIAVVLLILWALGLVTSMTAGGLIHALLVIAIVVVLLRVISGRKVL